MKKWLDNNDDLDEQADTGWELEVREPLIYQHILVLIEDTPAMYATIKHAISLAAATDATLYFLALPLIPTAAWMPDMMSITNELLSTTLSVVTQKGILL
jgi:hypothetical protein